jgi:hypothetical protein
MHHSHFPFLLLVILSSKMKSEGEVPEDVELLSISCLPTFPQRWLHITSRQVTSFSTNAKGPFFPYSTLTIVFDLSLSQSCKMALELLGIPWLQNFLILFVPNGCQEKGWPQHFIGCIPLLWLYPKVLQFFHLTCGCKIMCSLVSSNIRNVSDNARTDFCSWMLAWGRSPRPMAYYQEIQNNMALSKYPS